MYHETDFTADMSKYLKGLPNTHPIKITWAVEYKVCGPHKRLNYKSAFQPQQIPYLEKVRYSCVYKKLSDLDPSIKEFDAFQICHAPAYVAICWYTPRKLKAAHWIPIEHITEHKKTHKSISYLESTQFAEYIFNL